jgi:ABC-type sugar transport system permease subunit
MEVKKTAGIAAPVHGPIRRPRFRPRLGEMAFAALLLAPSIVIFGTFAVYPLIKTFYLGFYRSDPFGLSST